MADPPQHFENLSGAHGFHLGQQTINLISGNQYLSNEKDLILRLNPITDASHTRNRTTSPPDSACFPGTRTGVIKGITSWVDTRIVPMSSTTIVHVYWFHGFAGSGKSAISLEIAKIYAGSGRLLASYFFFRNAGERSKMNRFAMTLASQLVAAVPAAASFIKAALKKEPGLLTPGVSLATQLERLVYEPFRAAVKRGLFVKTLAKGPFLIVVDGLDECEDKRGVQEFISHTLDFFKRHPSTPLRIFIASRVEQHISAHLKTDGVLVQNLDDESSDEDVEKFLHASFHTAAKQDPIIQAYIHGHGSWPTRSDMGDLIRHIGGSFVLASTIFKYIVQPVTVEDPLTPMDRLPRTLEMNGLDGLYAQTLARSQHLPHFRNIISTIALLKDTLSIVEISALLGIEAFEVICVLLNLQAVIHVPGTDEEGKVTLCHTSLRDFLTIESRSGAFFVPPSFHLYLSYYCFTSLIERCNEQDDRDYCWYHFDAHWRSFSNSPACNYINEIEELKARQPLLVNRVPYNAFLCSMFLFTLFLQQPSTLNDQLSLLTDCAKQLALAVECPDHHIQSWLKKKLHYEARSDDSSHMVQFTEHTYKSLQQDMQRASATLHVNFPEVIISQPTSAGTEKDYVVRIIRLSGVDIFMALEWIVARARCKWEEMKITPHPPLDLSISCIEGQYNATISFDGVSAINDSDEAFTSSESD